MTSEALVTASGDSAGEFGSYFGGKSGAGVYQTLINLIPKHEFSIVPFAGHCAITRRMRPAYWTVMIDRDASVVDRWHRYSNNHAERVLHAFCGDGIPLLQLLVKKFESPYRTARRLLCEDLILLNQCGIGLQDWVSWWLHEVWSEHNRTFIYVDPPYPLETRGKHRYQFDMNGEQHNDLLRQLQSLNQVPVDRRPLMMVSSYFTERYAAALSGWNHKTFQAQTRGGLRTEHVWMNYSDPVQLHDYRYLGGDKQERFKLERRRKNLIAKLSRLPAIERNALMQAAMSEFREEQRPQFV